MVVILHSAGETNVKNADECFSDVSKSVGLGFGNSGQKGSESGGSIWNDNRSRADASGSGNLILDSWTLFW